MITMCENNISCKKMLYPRTNITTDYLDMWFNWPVLSPDINVIVHLWDKIRPCRKVTGSENYLQGERVDIAEEIIVSH